MVGGARVRSTRLESDGRDDNVIYSGTHNCSPIDEVDFINMGARRQFLELAGTTSLPPSDVYGQFSNSLRDASIVSPAYITESGHSFFPTHLSLRSAVSRVKSNTYPPLPESIYGEEDIIPIGDESFQWLLATVQGERFFLHEGKVPHLHRGLARQSRVIMFSSDKLFQVLINAREVFSDGVHKCCPRVYSSYGRSALLYVICAEVGDRMVCSTTRPCINTL